MTLELTRQDDGTLAHLPGTPAETVWTVTNYTEPPCDDDCECSCHTGAEVECLCQGPLDCTVCHEPIYGEHYACLDDGTENAHLGCVDVVNDVKPEDRTVLFEDLFSGAEVVIRPNGRPEIWVRSPDGRRGFTITGGDGPAGLGIEVRPHMFTADLDISANTESNAPFPPQGHRPRLRNVWLTQYRPDAWSQRFRAWVQGWGDHPGDRPDS